MVSARLVSNVLRPLRSAQSREGGFTNPKSEGRTYPGTCLTGLSGPYLSVGFRQQKSVQPSDVGQRRKVESRLVTTSNTHTMFGLSRRMFSTTARVANQIAQSPAHVTPDVLPPVLVRLIQRSIAGREDAKSIDLPNPFLPSK